MPLLKRTIIEGWDTVIEQDPPILTLPDAVYMPIEASGPPWGIFDAGGKLVHQTKYFRGPLGGDFGYKLFTSLQFKNVRNVSPQDTYVYGGDMAGHYGHFVCSTLSRYWAFDTPSWQGIKILYHSPIDISRVFEQPYGAALFGAMGLTPSNFVRFTEPTRIPQLIIPCPSFEETGFAHRAFARLGQKIGDTLTRGKEIIRCDVPVYLSKARLQRGVGHLINESELDEILSRHGIDIVYPEQLSVADQIAVFRSRPIITAMTGSALHTTIFAPRRVIVSMAFHNSHPTTYDLIDRITDSRAYYVYPHDDIERLPDGGAFSAAFRLTDVKKTAQQFLRLIDIAASMSPDRTQFTSQVATHRRLSNIALGKPTRQISYGPREDLHTPAGYASTATSGLLTGRYQFHTDMEQQPWWEVDLGQVSAFDTIRLHNRSDNSQERASRFVILASSDGEDWNLLHRQDEPIIFGNGLEGNPFVWYSDNSVRARFVRLRLLTETYFHLDQVEILVTDPARAVQRDNCVE